MRNGRRIGVVIPALNEESSLPGVLGRIPRWVDRIVVVDNGSIDGTQWVARASGAHVIVEPLRGYGSACMAGIRAAHDCDVLVFLDADGSDYPEEMERLVDPIIRNGADLVIGSRTRGHRERGAMSLPQRFGNFLAPFLIRLIWRQRYSDLGPFRAIRTSSLQMLGMDARTFGWTVQMQIRAARIGLRSAEVPVDYSRRKGGQSKISGTVRGVLGAGFGILLCVAREAWLTHRSSRPVPASAALAGRAIPDESSRSSFPPRVNRPREDGLSPSIEG